MLKFGIDRAAEFAPLFAGRVALITAPSGRSSDNVGASTFCANASTCGCCSRLNTESAAICQQAHCSTAVSTA